MRFFVVGSGRCGTTMLWRMLNLHPDLFVFRETHWHPKLFEFYGLGTAPPAEMLDVVDRTCFIEGQPTTTVDDELREVLLSLGPAVSVRQFSDGLGRALAARVGKTLWADKTPDYTNSLGTLQLIFDDCKIVHLVRDGRAVARSMSHHPGYRWLASAGELSWVPASFNGYHSVIETREAIPLDTFARLWRQRIHRAREGATRLKAHTYREFRYEDFVTQPETTLQALANFVDLRPDASWLKDAARLVDSSRMNSAAGPHVPMGPEELALQRELGYSHD